MKNTTRKNGRRVLKDMKPLPKGKKFDTIKKQADKIVEMTLDEARLIGGLKGNFIVSHFLVDGFYSFTEVSGVLDDEYRHRLAGHRLGSCQLTKVLFLRKY